MEKSVKGIREAYHRDLIDDYLEQREKSFLYRAFWADSVKGLLKESLPPLPGKSQFRKQMEELNEGFLCFLADEKNGPEQMEEHWSQLPEGVQDLLKIHLPQLPENTVKLLREHFGQLPEEGKNLLSERFPWLLKEEPLWPNYRAKILKLLKENMLERPEWARQVLLKKPPQKKQETTKAAEQGQKQTAKQGPKKAAEQEAGQGAEPETGQKAKKTERRDFFEELWLNNAGYKAKRITDTEYYLWLAEYLAARGIYYKDVSISDGHVWLYELLRKGLGRELEESVRLEEERKLPKAEGLEKNRAFPKFQDLESPQGLQKRDRNVRDKAGVGRDLDELAKKIREEAETGGMEISCRLHDLKKQIKDKNGRPKKVDYLLWLTRQLERMAVHIKIKTWLQDNGYPLGNDDSGRKLLQEARKQDFSMWLFGEFCDSEKGYDFIRKEDGGGEADEGWKVSNGFCVWRPEGFEGHLQKLLNAVEQKEDKYFYFPLAMDLHSGCVFFLAGKGYYSEVYHKSANQALLREYNDKKEFFCYDYLCLARGEDSENSEMAYRLQPHFHANAGKGYETVLQDFKHYCEGAGKDVGQGVPQDVDDGNAYYCQEVNDIPRMKIKAFNEEALKDTPKVFQWAFEGAENSEPSRKSRAGFIQARRKAAEMAGRYIKDAEERI